MICTASCKASPSSVFDRVSELVDKYISSDGRHDLETLCRLWSEHLVVDPADAVLMDFGISVGMPPTETLPTVPDVLLAFIDVRGNWHWPHVDRPGIAHNLHCVSSVNMPCGMSYPVWITVGNMKKRRQLMHRLKHVDIFGYILHNRRQMFWRISFREFIETTWHPSRVQAWCFDQEDLEVFC